MMKLIVAFCDFVNMPQNHYDILSGYDVCQYDHCDLFGLKQGDALLPLPSTVLLGMPVGGFR